ncbi:MULTISPECIES: chloride channel protein [Acidithiobacillus]|uniref:Chloride channel protein n=2 Tax=Acidithiobacillus ferrooxidans TaxID=920 RepID=A0A2W1KI57_ACIFR|nr:MULTISPECIES: chloride channel protein [Acidithiobacillus]ACH83204.1 Chloride channel core [Acidithiobacillus ferrooxidans ATCC 53993]MBN6745624.1 chloride channel protein [Acidithiobacillus sp. MC2.2]MBN6748523.1 chloride channel protein [Acidithiobacillus sp. PG05]MBU2775201.1 chloride channel protein [Acidithiobacillus ferrooxidans]MBU2819644.1 chloride channel protein [Acidithiobacillus ferrooxidans]
MANDSFLPADMDTLVMERDVQGWQGVFRTNPAFHLVLAFFVGIVAGLGAVAFRRLIGLMHNAFFFGQISSRFDDLRHSAASFWGLGVVLVPVLGGLVVVWLVRTFAPEAKGHGVPEVMDAIYYGSGVIRPVVVLVKALASSISIGSGGSVGREGPIIQIGAAFGSSLAQWLRLQEWQRLGLIAAGAGAGIAATFNTPVGGILFAIELMLVEVSARTLVPVMIATGTAAFVSRLFLGDYPSFIISQHIINRTMHQSAGAYAAYVLLGLLAGGAGLLFTSSLYWTEDRFERWIKNPYARHAAGMLGVGLVIYFMITFTGHYYVEGVGYATVQDVLDGAITHPGFLLLLLLLKILTFSVTLGSGGSGGVFSPSLYVGAVLGGLYAVIANHLLPGIGISMTIAAALGMAGMVAASTGAAVTGAVMIFEMTSDYHIIIPLIIVASLAFGVRRLITRETIYTRKLIRRGHFIPEARHSNLYLMRPAGEFMETPLIRVKGSRTLADIAVLLHRGREIPHILVLEGTQPRAVLTAPRVRELLRHRQTSTPIGNFASEDWFSVPVDCQIYDLVARFRATHQECALLCRIDPPEHHEDVIAIVTIEDVLAYTSLPMRLLRPHAAQ